MGGVSKIFGLSPILIPLCFQEIGNEINVRQDFMVIWSSLPITATIKLEATEAMPEMQKAI